VSGSVTPGLYTWRDMLPRALFLFLLVMLAPPLSLQQEQQQAASLANIFDLAKAGRYVPPLLCFLHGEIKRQRQPRRSSVNIWTFGRNNLSLNGCCRWWWIHHPLPQLSFSAVYLQVFNDDLRLGLFLLIFP
jgi:hypothetical protein